MKNTELIAKMQEELSNYQIGLHNICVSKYQSIISLLPFKKEEFKFTSGEVTSSKIAKNILDTGLKVLDEAFGLKSTVTFIDSITDNTLNYNYNSINDYVTNIIIGIPLYLNYQGKNYYIGDLRNYINIGNLLLFNPVLPPPFIYGYYEMAVKQKNIPEYPYFTYLYDEDIVFYENPTHYSKLSPEKQQEILKIILHTRPRNERCLKLANDTSILPLLLTSSFERYAVLETRKQLKKHTLTMKQ